jgi:hypothetical protein
MSTGTGLHGNELKILMTPPLLNPVYLRSRFQTHALAATDDGVYPERTTLVGVDDSVQMSHVGYVTLPVSEHYHYVINTARLMTDSFRSYDDMPV